MFYVRVMTTDGILVREESFSTEEKAMNYFDDMLNTYNRYKAYITQLIDNSDNIIAEI